MFFNKREIYHLNRAEHMILLFIIFYNPYKGRVVNKRLYNLLKWKGKEIACFRTCKDTLIFN